jgi:predicted hydrocarbon binding protein/predicted transcriptional regulator
MMQHPVNEGPRHRWQDYEKIKQDVVEILTKHHEGVTGAKIAGMVGITQGAMSKYLSMLSVDGIITSRKVGVAKLWKLVSSSDRMDLLTEKLGSENVNFKDYVLSLVEKDGLLLDPDNKQVLMMHSVMLVDLYNYTKSILGSEVHAFFYEWGKSFIHGTKDLVQNVAEKTGSNFISSFLSLLQLRGWGRFDIKSLSENLVEIVWHDSFWAKTDENAPADDFVVGALTAAASVSFGGNWRFTEVECKSMGASQCRFTGMPTD